MHQEMKKRKYERYCADEGGLLHCNYDDANFVDALLDYVNTSQKRRNSSKSRRSACEHLNFAKDVEMEATLGTYFQNVTASGSNISGRRVYLRDSWKKLKVSSTRRARSRAPQNSVFI